ncbi:hypothetical protein JCM15519_22360 [Fundidesulfovibrio butyratiphilus]
MYQQNRSFRCDICNALFLDDDLYDGKAIYSEEGKHVCKECVDDYKKNSDCPEDLFVDSMEAFASEHGNRMERKKNETCVLDELLAEADKKHKLE